MSITGKTWEDIKEGDVIPEVVKPVTMTTCALDAAATRDFFPGHHDPEYARMQGNKHAYLNTMFFTGFLDKVGLNWTGPDSFLVKRQMKMGFSVCVGDTMRTQARVVKKYEQEGKTLVDIDVNINTENGPCVQSQLTIWVPRRGQHVSFN